jgi:hypothetical protein
LSDRGFEHTIELEEEEKLVITTPYGHQNKFKDELEKAIKELLKMGHIRPSSNPFASSIVFVKKKDGTMSMCIEYPYTLSLGLMSFWMSCMELFIFRRLIFDRGIVRLDSKSMTFPRLLSDANIDTMIFWSCFLGSPMHHPPFSLA